MNNSRFGIQIRRWSAVFFGLALIATSLIAVSCGKKPEAPAKVGEGHVPHRLVDYYTCTMHPSVHSKDPGKCPICSMDLVPVYKASGQEGEKTKGKTAKPKEETKGMPGMETAKEEKPSEFTVPVERQQQIGVTYATVARKPLRHTIRAAGMVSLDKQRRWDVVSRVQGYVQKLHVASAGDVVDKDQPLMTMYSPDLLTSQRELVDLLRMRDEARTAGSQSSLETTERLIESAKRRLMQWNVTEKQIADLEQSRKPSDNLTLLSPFRGIVQELPVDQGRSVMVGDRLVDVADLSVVWVWAEFYQDELPMLKKGLIVAVTTSSYTDEKFSGAISVIDPSLNEAKRTARVRLDIENTEMKLRPGMYVNAELAMDMGESLTLPVSAVLPTGKRNIVFVDKGEGKLEPRFVELSGKYGDVYAVKEGVKEGERVVASANFLIDAEAQVQGALKSW